MKCLEHCDVTRKIKPKTGENAFVTQNRSVYRRHTDRLPEHVALKETITFRQTG